MDCDVLVIGSGFGGGAVALRAAQAGQHVIVLERGEHVGDDQPHARHRHTGRLVGFSRHAGTRQLARRPPALIECQSMRGLTAVVGCGVGGGSTHYTSVTMPADDSVFANGWPTELTAAAMRSRYEQVRQRLAPLGFAGTAPRTTRLEHACQSLGWACRRTESALRPFAAGAPPGHRQPSHWRGDLQQWMRGDGAGMKTTVWDAYLKQACSLGAQIRTRHTAIRVQPLAVGYAVTCRGGRVDHGHATQRGQVTRTTTLRASRVVLAMGAVGTTRLLLESRFALRTLPRLSDALGHGFTTNGDLGGLLISLPLAESRADAAPIATAVIDRFAQDRMMIMDLGAMPVVRRWLPPAARGCRPMQPWMLGVMHADAQPGRLTWNRPGRMAYRPGIDAAARDVRSIERLAELARACSARLVHPPKWFTRRHAVTVHPLGGCCLADSPERGVCDGRGEVYGYGGLFVADGSVIPTALGCPPSMTIAAVAEHIASAVTA